MTVPVYQVDAFTDHAFAGNPAGVCLLDEGRDAAWMQQFAAEMNLSETAFVFDATSSNEANDADAAQYDLRWFTPGAEVDLCGHATLASAHVLWSTDRVAEDQAITFHTRSGPLMIRRNGAWIDMNFPAQPAAAQVTEPQTQALVNMALDYEPIEIHRNQHDHLVLLRDARQLRAMEPDFDALAALEGRGVIVTAPSDDERYDFFSRYFAPKLRVAEDPVTGSTHCFLGPYWSKKLNKTEMSAYQISNRGGALRLNIDEDRVHIAGQAVTVFEGVINDQAFASATSKS